MDNTPQRSPRGGVGLALRRDLGLELLTFYLLFVLPIVIATLAFDLLGSARLQADVKAADLALARAIALETDAKLADAIYTVERMAEHPAVQEANIDGMATLFAEIAQTRSDVNLIYRLGPDGVMLYHHPVGPRSTVGVDFSFRDYFQDARRQFKPILSKGRISPTTEQAVTTAVMPVRNAKGAFLGVVATNIRLQSLSETLASIASESRPEEGFAIRILDSAGQIIADQDPEQLLSVAAGDLASVSRDVLLGEGGTRITHDDQGEEWLNSYVPITSAGWGVIVRRPARLAFATANAFHRGLLIALGVFAIGGLSFWLALSRRIILPLERLAAYSISTAERQPAAEEVLSKLQALAERPDQMGHLVRNLRWMAQSIEQRLNELSTLLDTSKAVLSTLESQSVLERILEQAARLVGADTCAILALDPATQTFRIQASRGLSEVYISRLTIDPSEPNSPSMRAIRSRHPIQVSDTETDPTFRIFRPRARAEGYRAILAVPLLARHAPPSSLVVYYREPHEFTEREVELVWSFANQAAMAIENATLYARSDERLQEQTRRLEALIQSLSDGLILEDLAGNVLYCNRTLFDLAGLTPEQALGSLAADIRQRLIDSSSDPEQTRELIEAALEQPESKTAEWTMPRGRLQLTLRLQAFHVTDTHGERIGRGQLIQDVTHDREIERMKDSLIATVSHELRTPLAAIKGYATTLLAEDVRWDSSSQREFLRVISQETDRLSHLVSDLLDLSRLESGSLDIEPTACSLEDIIQRAIQQARPGPQVRLQVELPPNLPMLLLDPRKVESVIRNLVENALKYAAPEGPVTISVQREDGQLTVRVQDEGPGIPAEHAETVFQPFVRLDDLLSRDASGAGLGLSICRGFVRAHGGEIWIEDRDRGTCVAFTLPITELGSEDYA